MTNVIEYEKDGDIYLLRNKYTPNLGLYLVVEVKLDNFTQDVKKIFFFNLMISLLVTSFIAIIIILLIRKYHKKLESIANYDNLTKIANRHNFNYEFEKYFSLSKRNKESLSLLFIDIDNFKNINDTLGHDIGDRVLIKISKLLKQYTRKEDLLARWGGEEFVILLINSDLNTSTNKAEELRYLIENNTELQDLLSYKITASFGLTKAKDNDSIEDIIIRADKAMYESKHSGKNRVTVY